MPKTYKVLSAIEQAELQDRVEKLEQKLREIDAYVLTGINCWADKQPAPYLRKLREFIRA